MIGTPVNIVICRSGFSAYCVTAIRRSAMPCHLWMGVESRSIIIAPKTVTTLSRGFYSNWRCCNFFVVKSNLRPRRHRGGSTLQQRNLEPSTLGSKAVPKRVVELRDSENEGTSKCREVKYKIEHKTVFWGV